MTGRDFIVKLTGKTRDDVLAAIKIFLKNRNVKYSIPNYYIAPG